MESARRVRPSRRQFLTAMTPALVVLASRTGVNAQPRRLAPTPACGEAGDTTPPQTAGPFFKPSSPERASLLEPGMTGTKIVLTGLVLGTDCAAVKRALLDVWHADDRGQYDNTGFRLRGHQFTDGEGRYRLETIMPGLYTGRARHFHVKVQAPDGPVLTTQLYFPGDPGNSRDGLFDPALVVKLADAGDGKRGTFDFVLAGGRPR